MALLDRLTSPGPKRILSLDGGGIRGLITLGFLTRIEQLLRERHRNPGLRLRDYFDLIGGTSTGAIIASGLAIGLEVAEIKDIYLRLGPRAFGTTRWWWNWWQSMYDSAPLQKELLHVFGDRRLDDNGVTTGLCIVAKRADTGSTWPLINHPGGKYFEANRSILLRQALRASTAAPIYYMPEMVDVGGKEQGLFLDGGVSLANNPALQLFLLATLKGFPFRWSVGADRLLLVSVGTGGWKDSVPISSAVQIFTAFRKRLMFFVRIITMLQDDGSRQAQLILQYLSHSVTPWMMDREVGDLSADLLTPQPALTYLRYDAVLEREGLEQLGLPELVGRVTPLREMSATENTDSLKVIGERAAEVQIRTEHFPVSFDVK